MAHVNQFTRRCSWLVMVCMGSSPVRISSAPKTTTEYKWDSNLQKHTLLDPMSGRKLRDKIPFMTQCVTFAKSFHGNTHIHIHIYTIMCTCTHILFTVNFEHNMNLTKTLSVPFKRYICTADRNKYVHFDSNERHCGWQKKLFIIDKLTLRNKWFGTFGHPYIPQSSVLD